MRVFIVYYVCVCMYVCASSLHVCIVLRRSIWLCAVVIAAHTHAYSQQGKSIMRILSIKRVVTILMPISMHFANNDSFSYILHKNEFTCHSQHLPNLK